MNRSTAASILEALGVGGSQSPGFDAIGGGDINAAWKLTAGGTSMFVKTNRRERLPMFEAEAAGLEALRSAAAIAVPAVLGCGTSGKTAWLCLEYLEFVSAEAGTAARLGTQLAALHRTSAPQHGFERDNTIGLTPQRNTPDADWPRFYARTTDFSRSSNARPRAASTAACSRSASGSSTELTISFTTTGRCRRCCTAICGAETGRPARIDAAVVPVIYDPATYYGDRETDIAMTELFGGFPPSFREAYETAWPLDPGYVRRRPLYQAYHLLNHLNLFGRGYLASAIGALEQALSRR